ncbi:restriction endonuclease [Bacillus weihaiensis]|uniref:Restriction endonuclease n=1 Tax=Bacillus weihaiensis TaxID=1547283 RepID=A0A1L3MWA3_9BACI|nr:restriction endonuclease [Bacillus weihaiensis]APH06621.1 restriction endonuclease [Bacillus weihaiensis]
MTYRIEEKKWILYRHTSDFNIISTVAIELKSFNRTLISEDKKLNLLQRLREMNFYTGRNPGMPLDSINHRINTLEFFMFGYKDKVDGQKRFLFSPLGNLFLNNIGNKEKIRKIFLTMLWALQFPHTYGGTDRVFEVFPFRLIFKLLTDERLEYKLYAFEYAYLVAFTQSINDEKYEELVNDIINLRALSNAEIEILFNNKRHVLVNAVYEWDYYYRRLFEQIGLFNVELGDQICRIQQGNTNTFRKVTRNSVSISDHIYDYCLKLLEEFPFDEQPLKLNDPERLKKDIIKEIHSFYPKTLLREIGELDNELELKLLELPKLIEQYSNNNDGAEAYLFEDVLVDGFNMFHNVQAEKIGGAGNTDIECLYIDGNMKFAVDAKSTKNKLSSLNAGRLALHREKIGGEYTIVVTSRYVPAVRNDIRNTPTVIILARTFSEFLYNCINNDVREVGYSDFNEIISNNLGNDVSNLVSDLTINMFSVQEN